MKLHLHWLRFDLHRFRVLLGVWTLLVAAYAVFLGWVHLRFLTLSPEILDRSLYVAVLLGLVELCFLFALFNADPAKGPRHFWRTRPPSGVAVAGSKLVLALAFFVALPLLAWGAVNAFCVLPEYAVTLSPTGLSWTAFLFWIQSLTVSAFAMAAARASGKREFYLHLFVSTAMVACAVWALQEIWIWAVRALWNEFGVSSLDVRLARWLGNGFGSLPMAVLTLAAASLYLLRVRRRRLPRGHGMAPLVLLPMGAMLTAATILDEGSRKEASPLLDELLTSADSAVAANIRVVEMPLHTGKFLSGGYPPDLDSFNPLHPPPRQMRFSTLVKVEGLPPGAWVSARWLDLRLATPGGAVIHGDTRHGKLKPERIRQYTPDNFRPWPVSFPKRELDACSTDRCTASGTLRLTLYTWKSQRLPLLDGQLQSSPAGPLVMRRTQGDFLRYREQAERNKWPPAPEEIFINSIPDRLSFLDFSLCHSGYPPVDSENGPPHRFYAVKGHEKIPLELIWDREPFPTGFLIRHQLRSCASFIQSRKYHSGSMEPATFNFEDLDLLKAVYTGRPPPEGWQLEVESSRPYATVDVPVTLHDIIPRTGRGAGAALLKALSGIHLRKNASLRDVRGSLRHAYGLIMGMPHIMEGSGPPAEWHRAVALWKGILEEATHADLPALLELIQEKNYHLAYYGDFETMKSNIFSPNDPYDTSFDTANPTHAFYLLIKRAIALLEPADMAAIPPDSHTARLLRHFQPAPGAPAPAPSNGSQRQ